MRPTSTRRRLASFVLLMVVLFLVSRYFRAQDQVQPVKIRYLLPKEAVALEATIRPHGGGEKVAYFSTRLIQTEIQTQSRLAVGTYEAELVLTFAEKHILTTRRTLVVEPGGEIVLDLRPERGRRDAGSPEPNDGKSVRSSPSAP